ncbi:hypothetical protein PPERSA_03295 [Pseudocohnilembus persalinus]|uniref:EF-hand domain-containing protein n=1 Tax=Pseudocohnilembus persalinus TaxID=266149 RepID=A0A0V0Q8D2_PSEPJ|nr:hypothetical protein PPERSA_03295 [Pseudocohnilembus persalinus]|eukprot:KRW98464.1 hypothetical protein PPERSA_03295 [Pseudocohnilembus persalinus]
MNYQQQLKNINMDQFQEQDNFEIQRNQKIEEALYYDHMRKQKQIQLSNLLKEEQMMNECSFSPYISEESRKIATKQKQKEKIDNIYSPYFEQQFIDKYLNTENIHDKLYHQAAFDEIRKNISNQQKYQKLNPHTPDLGPNKNRQIPEKSQKEHIKRLFQEKKELDDKLELQRNIQNLPYDKVTGQKLYQPLINKNDPIYQKVSKKIDEQDKNLMENLIKNNINSDLVHQVDGSTRPYQQMWELQLRNEFSSTNYPNSIQNLNAKRRCMTPNASTHQKQQILFPNQHIPTTQNTLNISITNNNNNNNNSSRSRSNSHNNNRSSSQSKGNKNKKGLNSARNLFGKNTKSMDENSKDLYQQNDSNRESSKNNQNNKKSAKIINSKSKKSSKKSSQKNSQRNSLSQNSTPNLKIKPQNLFEMENNQQKNNILQQKNIEDDDIVDYDKGDSNSHTSSNNEMPMFRQKVKNENRFKYNMVMVSFDTIQPHVKEKLKRLFGGLDSDGDGEISASEIDLSKIDSEELEIIQDILIEMEDEEKTLNFNQFIEKLIQKDLVKDIMRIYNLQTGFTLSNQYNEEEQQEGQINQSMQQRYGLEYQKKRKEIEDKKQQELLLLRQNQDFLEKEGEINIQGKRNQNKKRELQLNLNNLDQYNDENDFDNNYNVLFNNAQTDRGTYMADENKQNLNKNIKNSQIIGGLGNEGFTSARYKQIYMESLMNQNLDN